MKAQSIRPAASALLARSLKLTVIAAASFAAACASTPHHTTNSLHDQARADASPSPHVAETHSATPRERRGAHTVEDTAALHDLERLAAREDYPALRAHLRQGAPAHVEALQEQWLEDRLARGAASTVLAGSFAERLTQTGRGGEAHFWFLYGAIALQIDAARCDDVSAALAKLRAWRGETANQANAFERLTPADKARIAQAVLELESVTASTRVTDRWLCAEGADYWNAYFERYPERRGQDRRSLPRDLSIPVYAVDDFSWQAKRQEIRSLYRDLFTGDGVQAVRRGSEPALGPGREL